MPPPGRRGRPRPTIVILVLLTITVLTLDFRDVGVVKDARRWAGTALSPLQDAADWVGTPFANMWNGITHYNEVADENRRLHEELDRIEGQQARAESAAQVIERLEQLLGEADIPWLGDVGTATARVVQEPSNAFAHEIVIDKGSSSGIEVGMPVVTHLGLAGQVVEVEPNRAWVRLITDPEFNVGVRLVDNQRFGVSSGQGPNRTLRIDTGIEPDSDDADVPEGALLETSGIDNRSPCPALIPVARVVDAETANGGLNVELLAEPLVDLGELSFVNVLLFKPVE